MHNAVAAQDFSIPTRTERKNTSYSKIVVARVRVGEKHGIRVTTVVQYVHARGPALVLIV